MGRKKKHESVNERVKAHRQSKLESFSKKVYCKICQVYVKCSVARNEKEALRIHINNSRTHNNLVRQGYPYWKPDEDDNELVVEMELDENGNEVVDEMGFNEQNAEPVPVVRDEGNVAAQNSEVVNFDYSLVAEDCHSLNEDLNSTDVNVVGDRSFFMGQHAHHHYKVDMVADSVGVSANREYVLVKSYLQYGRKSVFDVSDSPIFDERKLRVGFNNILKGTSPYAFSKVNNREVDWLTALEITKDYIDSNESIKFGDRRIKTMINIANRNTSNIWEKRHITGFFLALLVFF